MDLPNPLFQPVEVSGHQRVLWQRIPQISHGLSEERLLYKRHRRVSVQLIVEDGRRLGRGGGNVPVVYEMELGTWDTEEASLLSQDDTRTQAMGWQ